MTIDDIRKDTRYWQRLLRLAGYYTGRIDGIRGPLQREAESFWDGDQHAAISLFGRLDERSERNLATVIPQAQHLFRQWLADAIPAANAQGYTLKVINGTRSYAEQDALYAQGRTKPGSRVTNARGGCSNHNFGLAIDIGLFDAQTGKYITHDAPYDALAKAVPPPAGIEWGGTWTFNDAPHYQYAKFGSTTKAIRKLFSA